MFVEDGVGKSLKISHSALNKHSLNTDQQSTSDPGQNSSGRLSGTHKTHRNLLWICKWHIRGPMRSFSST